MPLSKDEIIAIIRLEIEASSGYDSNVLGDVRARALDFYHGNTESGSIPTAPDGRSNIVSMDVHDTVNSLLAEVVPMLETSMVDFSPESRQDEQQARLESDYIKLKLDESGFDEIAYSCAHSGMLQGLGWLKIGVEEKTVVSRESYGEAATDFLVFDALSTPQSPGQLVDVTINDDTTEVKRETPTRKLKIESIAPENILFSQSHSQFDLDELRFIAERKLFTVDELVNDFGMQRRHAEEIPDFEDEYWPGMIARRERYQDEHESSSGWQPETRLKECFCCWMDLAMIENGPVEKYYLMVGGDHLIESRPVAMHPFVVGTPLPLPHRIQGRGMYEIMQDVQESKTSLLRTLIDNAMVANGSRTAYNENSVNVSHLTNGRVNGVVAVNGLPAEHIFPMPATDITMQMVPVLQYLDEVRSSRGGATIDMNDAEMQTASSSAEAAYNVKVSKEKMAGFYARNLVCTLVKGAYLKTHRTLREYFPGPAQARIRGEWTQTDPGMWPERQYCTVVPGLTEVERRQKIQNQTFLVGQLQQINSQGGHGILTDVSKVYNALAEWIRCANLGQPEEYLLDPNSPPSQQAQAERAQQQQGQLMQTQSLMQQEQALKETALELDKYKHDTELQWKYFKERLDTIENAADNRTQIEVAGMHSGESDEG